MNSRTTAKYLIAALLVFSSMLTNLSCAAEAIPKYTLKLSSFSSDITPPIGSPLLAGFITPALTIEDKLQARGIVIQGAGKPIVLCSLDWAETNNYAYDHWRETLAKAAGTDASHVAVQSIHPHDTPWANLEANKILQEADHKLKIIEPAFFHAVVDRTAEALKQSLSKTQTVTHIGTGKARVEKVASARRVLGQDGKVAIVRLSKMNSAEARNAPEGLVDPDLRTVSFWNGDKPVAALHYYAVHPMSNYGAGHVSSDFCGLARELRQTEQPDVFQVYFTGCAGNVTAGKYNDGSRANRDVLRDRMRDAMVAAWKNTTRKPISTAINWRTVPVNFPTRSEPEYSEESLRKVINDSNARPKTRAIAAIKLSWLLRESRSIEISCLEINDVCIVHFPGEPFIEYQLYAQKQSPDKFVCVAGYGDGGMGYIPLKDSFKEGGYEPTMSYVSPDVEDVFKKAITELLAPKK